MGKDKKSASPPSEKGTNTDWLLNAIDTLAAEYHWRKSWILEDVYFDELFFYFERIKKRKVNEYKMQLAIAQNPHIADEDERRELWDSLNEAANNETVEEKPKELDVGGFEFLKLKMSENPRIVVK